MNSLIIFPEELEPKNRAVIRGDRAAYLHEWHKVVQGMQIRGGIWKGPSGTVRVDAVRADSVELTVDCSEAPLQKEALAAIVAVPRPQTVKKVIQAVTAFGLRELHFVRSENVVPSYLSSTSLTQHAIQLEVLKALEQCCDTIPPEITIHPKWHEFINNTLGDLTLQYEERVVADTHEGAVPLSSARSSRIFAIGPESGWTDKEVQVLRSKGFIPCTLGKRMLRVEHAVVQLAGSFTG